MATVKSAISASVFDDYLPFYGGNSAFDRDIDDGMVLQAFIRKGHKNKFVQLIDSRCDYLDSLKTLNADWISGSSEAPSPRVLDEAKTILVDFGQWLDSNKEQPVPRLVMGPIPAGGIAIEIIVDGKVKILLNLYNNEASEIEVENTVANDYIDIDTTDNSIPYLLKQAYKYFSN